MPDPTEQSILSQTLLPPSALPTIISIKTFTSLFPPSLRDHPQVTVLYRNLQHQRNLDLDHVIENVAAEARRGELQRRELAKTRWRDAKGIHGRASLGIDVQNNIDAREDGMEGLLYGRSDTDKQPKPFTLATIVPALEAACEELAAENDELEQESNQLLEQLQSAISDLSDLRYGKVTRPELTTEVVEGLKQLDKASTATRNP